MIDDITFQLRTLRYTMLPFYDATLKYGFTDIYVIPFLILGLANIVVSSFSSNLSF